MAHLTDIIPLPDLKDSRLSLNTLKDWASAIRTETHRRGHDTPSDRNADAIQELIKITDEIYIYLEKLQAYLDKLSHTTIDAINNHHMVGTIAERPSAAGSGWQYLSTDETPESLYVSDGTNWHQFDSV